MKRLAFVWIGFLVLTALASCKKTAAPTAEDLLTQAPWLGDHVDVVSEYMGGTTADISNERLEMFDDYTYKYYVGEQLSDEGNWRYNADVDSLYFYPVNDDPVNTKVITLSETQLTLRFSEYDTLAGRIDYTAYFVRE